MTMTKKEYTGLILIIVVCVIASIAVFNQGAIPQDINYHHFKDTNPRFGIANFWNVVSNLPFLFVGCLGLYRLRGSKNVAVLGEMKYAYMILFAGVAMVSVGSSYYHLDTNNQTLVWDRLPMTIAFMALFSIVIAEFISISTGKALLLPLLIAGVLSVAYWHFSEQSGRGDLRYYALVQFLPMLIIPIILICFGSRYTGASAGYWGLLVTYLIAKIFEYYDAGIFDILKFISGHSIKHVMAAAGMYILLKSYEDRDPQGTANPSAIAI